MPMSKQMVIASCVALGAVVVGANVVKIVTRAPDHPSAWDPRVAELVEFVERERGLDFDHPVEVRFLHEDEFRGEVTADQADLNDEELEDVERVEATGRAFGLLGPDDDLFEQSNTLRGEGVLAYYSPEHEEIVVRGTELDVAMESTLVHELVHALQDQAFDLDQLQEQASDSAADLAITALIEGDASTVESAWVDALDEDEQARLDELMGAVGDGFDEETEDVSPAITALFGAPYQLGPGFVEVLRADGGRLRLDEAFESPPLSDAHLLRPDRFLAGDQPQTVEPSPLPTGAVEHDTDAMGALGTYLALAGAIDPVEALEAADGWDGDSLVTYEQSGQTCAQLDLVGADGEATDRLERAFTDWARDREGFGEVRREGDRVVVRACDPGKHADHASEDEIALPFVRASLLDEFVRQDMPVDVAACTTQRIVVEFPTEVLLADDLPDDELARVQDEVADIVTSCDE
jgi:hypothetical protein